MITATAQLALPGEVVEVIDGKTVVVAISTGKVRVELQYIDVPEAGQQLSDTVRIHLRNLVLGKKVDYRPRTLFNDHTVGLITLNNIDISQQMLRDGAAWLVPLQASAQDRSQYDAYASLETAAKNERIGIWAVPGLKPAWEFRAEKLGNENNSNKYYSIASNGAPQRVAKPKGVWSDKNPKLGNVGALSNGYNAASKTGYLGTSLLGVTEINKDMAMQQKTGIDLTYYYKEDDKKGRQGVFTINLISVAKKWRFLKNNNLELVSNGRVSIIGKAKRTASTYADDFEERVTYEITRETLDKLANGENVFLKAGDYLIQLSPGLKYLLYNMLELA